MEVARSGHWAACPACGNPNGEWEIRCAKCGRRLEALGPSRRAAAEVLPPLSREAANASGSPARLSRPGRPAAPRPAALPHHVRQQLQSRVQRFRARQEHRTAALPLAEEPPPNVIAFPEPASAFEPARRPASEKPPRAGGETLPPGHRPAQPELNFPFPALSEPLRRSFPVAPLALRMAALLKDAQYVAGAILFFLAGLSSARLLDTSLTPSPLLLGSAVCGSLVVILLFGLVFVWGAATTPGMKSAGLCLVSFDGRPAPRRQRLWRVLGGIVSAGSFFIGYLWALADEETLYWHDHISKTYLALSAALPANEHR